jgi:ATP-dependent protease Clp ATPase subunit
MFLNEDNHVKWDACSAYDASKCQAFLDTYSVGLTEGERIFCTKIAEGYARLQERKELNSKVDMTLPPY